MNEHSKKGSRTLLLLLLLLVCIVGAVLFFWLSGRPTADGADAAPESAPPSSDVSPVSQTIDPARQRYQFTLADSQEQETSDNFSFYQKYFWLGDRLVRLTPGESADVYLDLRDAASGEVVQSIPYDDVAAILEQEDAVLSGLSLEADGTLRLLTCSGDSTYTLWQCPQDGASPVTVGPCSFLYPGCEDFAVWDPYVVTLGAGDGQLGSRLCLYDLTDGSTETMEDVAAFCLDGAGRLYYSDLQSGYLICRDLTTGSTLWQQKANCRQLFYHPQYGLFACASRTGQIQCHDPETGKVRYELFAWNEDTTLDYEDSGISQANFAVDNQYQVYFSVITAENYEPPITYTQYRWTFSPYLAEEAATALTITAPYQSSSLDSTIRMFQKLHPEITITWDTAFASEEDFRTHVDLRKQPLGFQGQVFVPQMVVAHYRVAPVLLHTKNCHFVVNSFHLEFHRVKGGELARLVRALCVNAKLIFPVGAVKTAVAAVLRRSGIAAVKVICSQPLLHELFKRPVAAGSEVHRLSPPFGFSAKRKAADFFQNLRLGRGNRKGRCHA